MRVMKQQAHRQTYIDTQGRSFRVSAVQSGPRPALDIYAGAAE